MKNLNNKYSKVKEKIVLVFVWYGLYNIELWVFIIFYIYCMDFIMIDVVYLFLY